MTSSRPEKIIISNRTEPTFSGDEKQNPPSISKKWRITQVGFTPLGGLLALICLMIIVMAPKLLADFFVSGFWNNAYGTRRAMIFSDFISWAILDQDYGYIGSYAIGSALALLTFYCMSQILEYFGYLVYREGEN
jgi:hypothetical protein